MFRHQGSPDGSQEACSYKFFLHGVWSSIELIPHGEEETKLHLLPHSINSVILGSGVKPHLVPIPVLLLTCYVSSETIFNLQGLAVLHAYLEWDRAVGAARTAVSTS